MAEVARQVKLRVLGTADLNHRVRAGVFASKLASLVKAIEAADREVNGSKSFEFIISDLKPTSAMAVVQEQRASRKIPRSSGVEAFGACVASINTGNYVAAQEYIECARQISLLAKDVEQSFRLAEITVDELPTVVIDKQFEHKAREAVDQVQREEPHWFQGVTFGSLDGRIIVESIQGGSTTMVLCLSIGGAEIKCLCPGITDDDIRLFFGKRVRVSGRITYKGDTGLPSSIELVELPRLIKSDADITKWRGAFGTPTQDRGWDR